MRKSLVLSGDFVSESRTKTKIGSGKQEDDKTVKTGSGKEKVSYFNKKVLLFQKYSYIKGKLSKIGASPSGKATGFDPVIRWFESSRPSQVVQVI